MLRCREEEYQQINKHLVKYMLYVVMKYFAQLFREMKDM